ncbi:hypothetical protein ACP70R_043372 [Stipagrostis hirtigluma subsp. patula]
MVDPAKAVAAAMTSTYSLARHHGGLCVLTATTRRKRRCRRGIRD